MPIYEYSCAKCGQKFEKPVKIGVEVTVACPNCGSKEVNRGSSSFSPNDSASLEYCGSEG